MDREHKYKAYINNPIHGASIFKVKSINFNPLVVTVIIPNGKYIDGIELTDEVQFFEGEVELLEYTGIKDKNGKEIYESDVVHCESNIPYTLLTITGIVEFLYGQWIVHCENFGNTSLCSVTNDIKLLSNIYENSETKNGYYRDL